MVSILAVLGESNIKINSHLITAQWTCLLPRLMPAPQGLLTERRMKQLPILEDVTVFEIRGKQRIDGINYFGKILIGSDLEVMPALSVLEYTITQKEGTNPHAFTSHFLQPKLFGPLNIIALLSFILSLSLFVWAIVIRDGVAVVGLLVMCSAAPLLCAGLRWHTSSRRSSRFYNDDPTEIVWRLRNGAFFVVHCTQSIASELFRDSNDANFLLSGRASRISGGVIGGLFLTMSIVLFGNCTWTMQVAIGVSYALLNVAYWIATILPESLNWNFDEIDAHRHEVEPKGPPSYTQSVWNAMWASRSSEWVWELKILPTTDLWRAWHAMAAEQIRLGNEHWDAVRAKDEIFKIKLNT